MLNLSVPGHDVLLSAMTLYIFVSMTDTMILLIAAAVIVTALLTYLAAALAAAKRDKVQTVRMMEENEKLVDALIYVLDARAYRACFNPSFDKNCGK